MKEMQNQWQLFLSDQFSLANTFFYLNSLLLEGILEQPLWKPLILISGFCVKALQRLPTNLSISNWSTISDQLWDLALKGPLAWKEGGK
jgi:hypothetical protein